MPTPADNLAGIFSESGYWWPAGCRGKTDRYIRHERDSDHALKLVPKDKRQVCVQAGAHNGLWALRLAEKFKRVVTFEPEAANWECLLRNTQNEPKIQPHRALLGERSGNGTLLFNEKNAGGHKCQFDGDGDMPVVAIDDLGLEGVGLIYLDIEGAELPAFKGAVRTISRCRPVIAYEERGHGQAHGYAPEDMEAWLRAAGYTFHSRVARDRLWVPVHMPPIADSCYRGRS